MIGFIARLIGGIFVGVIVRLCVLAIVAGIAIWWLRGHVS